jgi:hypothetical protein
MGNSKHKTRTPEPLDPCEIGEIIILGDDLRWTYSIQTGDEVIKGPQRYSSPVTALREATAHVEKLLNPSPNLAW